MVDGVIHSADTSLSKPQENGEGQRSLAGRSPWGCTESDATEQLNSNSTGSGRDLPGHRRREASAVTPPQPTGEKAQRGQGPQTAGQATAQHTKAARKGGQRHRSDARLWTRPAGRAPGRRGRPAGHRDARRCSVHTESQDTGAERTPDSREPHAESVHCCLPGPENCRGLCGPQRHWVTGTNSLGT